MKYTRKAKYKYKFKGGDPLFIAAPAQQPQRLSEMIGVLEFRDLEAQQRANKLMRNKLFDIEKIKSSGHLPVNKKKIKNFAQSFASRIVQRGPNGKPTISVQNPNTNIIKKNLGEFSTALGFPPEESRPIKNPFGHPTNPSALGPLPGENPWQIRVGPQSGWHLGLGGGISSGISSGISINSKLRITRKKRRYSKSIKVRMQ
jgi:hypothetical protein